MSTFSQEENWNRSKMERLQQERLKETIERVYHHVPFYRKAFQQLNVTPDDIQSLEDIQQLPFTKKRHLRENYPFSLLATPMEEVVRIHASSGTSGKPTVVAYTKNDMEHWGEIVARSIFMAGGRRGDILHNAFGYGLFTGGLGIHNGSEHLGCATVPISGGNTSKQITLIQDFCPRVICSTPSYLLNIGETMKSKGIDPASTSLEFAILGAEPWSEEMRNNIEEMFGIKAADIYGLSEVMGPGVAMECIDCQEGLHIADDHFLVEVIDPETLRPVPDGEDGELVFTSLTKEALPIIRYRTGDISSITRGKCACGRTTTKMSRVKGRIDDMLIIRGVNVFPSEIERYICDMDELAPHYQIHLQKKGVMDHAELHVEVCENFFELLPMEDFNHPTAQELTKRIQRSIKMEALVSMDVYLEKPKAIPRSEGKAKRIVDLRSNVSTPL
ncbi:phenylacetate--CoA ligase [Halobacillus shinanisalinarum]|uniref:Phenylacetate-coenzyme A ligase n=1 Tax=Halobacillus shinanisalinarum TaxID=2932258 RepID=A0ABY4GWZ7_9BACI|nr:phenylacetate--CoA ligase PaaK [Halobacillus shinanisalinarum]UOQ92445.1 phenylacetate--CoA ligase [Halobacillus shinanisalinarum]